MSRRPLGLPITLAIIMLVLLVLVIVGWVLMFSLPDSRGGAIYYTLLVLGLVSLGMVIAGVVIYLTLSIKAINLNRRQSNFIDSVTHELKSPIASLKLCLQTLSRRPVSPDEQTEFYQFMLEDVERLDVLINHILSAARLEKGSTAESAERIDLSELLTACVEEVCNRYRVSTDIVTTDLVDCEVLGNRLDLGLIFRNLIDNAIKYADPGDPKCEVHSEYLADSGSVLVRIADNGQGIPAPLHRKIFGRFVRLGTELERKTPGTGLGLFIVRTLVARWKGRIQVTKSPAGGAEFQVTLRNAATRPADATSEVPDRRDSGDSSSSVMNSPADADRAAHELSRER